MYVSIAVDEPPGDLGHWGGIEADFERLCMRGIALQRPGIDALQDGGATAFTCIGPPNEPEVESSLSVAVVVLRV